jgi:outer membrane protein OmpA-like peptidoglycan-associated protein
VNRIEEMTMKNPILAALVAAALIAGCGTMPDRDSPLAQARADYSAAQANPQVVSLAPSELRQASDSLDKANAASSKGDERAQVDHLAYVAKQQVAIARETARQKAAELAVASAGAERDRVRLEARTREADAAQRNAEMSQRQSEASQRQSEASQRQSEASLRSADAARLQSEASQRSAEAARLQSEAALRQTQESERSADAARHQAQDAEGRTRQLEAQLKDLEAKKTDRGMVITLGDVLFDTNEARLKAGGVRNVQRLADFFKQYPQRTVMIEGFTDSTGTRARNQQLSDERAQAVRLALLDMGVAKERVSSRGYGESYPAANNDTAAGRQLNRRVEIVVSDDGGRIAPR